MIGKGGQNLTYPCSYQKFCNVYVTSIHNGACHVTCYSKTLTTCTPIARLEGGQTYADSLNVYVIGN